MLPFLRNRAQEDKGKSESPGLNVAPEEAAGIRAHRRRLRHSILGTQPLPDALDIFSNLRRRRAERDERRKREAAAEAARAAELKGKAVSKEPAKAATAPASPPASDTTKKIGATPSNTEHNEQTLPEASDDTNRGKSPATKDTDKSMQEIDRLIEKANAIVESPEGSEVEGASELTAGASSGAGSPSSSPPDAAVAAPEAAPDTIDSSTKTTPDSNPTPITLTPAQMDAVRGRIERELGSRMDPEKSPAGDESTGGTGAANVLRGGNNKGPAEPTRRRRSRSADVGV
jgi:hypothetical protein